MFRFFATAFFLVLLTFQPATLADTFADYDAQARSVLAKMTLAEKVGQVTQGDLESLEDHSTVAELCLGSVLSGGNSDPKSGNSLASWRDAYESCQSQAMSTRLAIPILYGIDAMHGHSNVLGAVLFPHNIGLGCTRNPKLVEEIARITALETRASGIHWAFSPCVTVPRDERWGRTYEGFSEDAETATTLGVAAIQGLQGDCLRCPLHVLACAKHFVGDGGTTAELKPVKNEDGSLDKEQLRLAVDQGDTRINEQQLRDIHLAPYIPAIRAGVGSVMVSYSSWNGVKCSGSKYLLTEVLKNEFGFEGIVISDWNAIDQITDDYKTAVKISINAGMDMFMVPDKYRKFITCLTELVEEGSVSMERLDDAVFRILRVKAAMGLLDDQPNVMADRELESQFGSDAHRKVARQAVRESLVLLKNNGVLPIAKTASRIHIAGAAADDLGKHCGGWTIGWQGETGEVTTGGTTILEAFQQLTSNVTYSADGTDAAGADVVVVVVGEKPYAEGFGDDGDLELSDEDLATIAKVKQSGVPMVVVLLSGRPMVVGETISAADAFIAAWLPGTEGQGVVDVLMGDFAPTGKLSMSWPRSVDQLPINVRDKSYDPLFPHGFGLTYEK